MKRIVPLLTIAALAGLGCRIEEKSTNIVAAGHVEATDVHISAKVAGTGVAMLLVMTS